jgi:translation initiation factor IF-1
MKINFDGENEFRGRKNNKNKNKNNEDDRSDHIERKGQVVKVLKGNFEVQMEDNQDILLCRISGKMRQNKIRVLLWDKVSVRFSVYDTSNNGIISRRLDE